MAKNGKSTRKKILDAAEELILERGYSGVSIDSVIEKVGITKGAFFYHFKSKHDLATALLQRYAEVDASLIDEFTARAEKLSRDPLQQVLIFIGLFEEMFDNLDQPFPGCLFASYIYELNQFDEQTKTFITESFLAWRAQLRERFERIVEKYPPKLAVDLDSLADEFTVVLEGAYVVAKGLKDNKVIAHQLRHYKNYVELLFA